MCVCFNHRLKYKRKVVTHRKQAIHLICPPNSSQI